jgi:hypothetical protein
MAFEWPKIYKVEEQIEQQSVDWVYEYVCEFYDVEDIEELTEEQINEIDNYRDGLSSYSVMQAGFSNIIHQWESAQYE